MKWPSISQQAETKLIVGIVPVDVSLLSSEGLRQIATEMKALLPSDRSKLGRVTVVAIDDDGSELGRVVLHLESH